MLALPKLILLLKKDQEPIIPAFITCLASCLPLRDCSVYCNLFLIEKKKEKRIMKHVSAVEMLQRVRNLVAVNENFEKNRTTRREIFGTEILFFGKDLREDPRGKHEEQVGVKEEEPAGVSCREAGREHGEVCLAGPREHPQLSAFFRVLSDR